MGWWEDICFSLKTFLVCNLKFCRFYCHNIKMHICLQIIGSTKVWFEDVTDLWTDKFSFSNMVSVIPPSSSIGMI